MLPQCGRCTSKAWLGSGQGHVGIEPILTCGLLDMSKVLDLDRGWMCEVQRVHIYMGTEPVMLDSVTR